jgi:hypothetical protein
MGTLKQDIKEQSKWAVKAFAADKLKLDYSIKSFIEIDKFFNKHTLNGKAVKGGRLSTNLGGILFSIGSYVGETIIKNVPGSVWITDDDDPQGELTVSIKLPGGSIIFPVTRVMKRFENGEEDSIYIYGHLITKDFTKEASDDNYWNLTKAAKPWWKFW